MATKMARGPAGCIYTINDFHAQLDTSPWSSACHLYQSPSRIWFWARDLMVLTTLSELQPTAGSFPGSWNFPSGFSPAVHVGQNGNGSLLKSQDRVEVRVCLLWYTLWWGHPYTHTQTHAQTAWAGSLCNCTCLGMDEHPCLLYTLLNLHRLTHRWRCLNHPHRNMWANPPAACCTRAWSGLGRQDHPRVCCSPHAHMNDSLHTHVCAGLYLPLTGWNNLSLLTSLTCTQTLGTCSLSEAEILLFPQSTP